MIYRARVAQLDRVPGYEPGGRRFDSCRVRHICLGEKKPTFCWFFLSEIRRGYDLKTIRSTARYASHRSCCNKITYFNVWFILFRL